MNYYQFHIGDFNSATRHLTLVERSLYRDLIDMYYDTEQAIDGSDFDRLARRLMCRTDDEKTALQYVLGEFFTLDGDLYTHERCECEIQEYQAKREQQSRAGKASAEKRLSKKSASNDKNQTSVEGDLTDVERTLNKPSTNHKPLTNNHIKKNKQKKAIGLPENFGISDRVREWAIVKGYTQLDNHLENFVGYARANGKTYVDWDQAFMNAIRNNWAKLGNAQPTEQKPQPQARVITRDQLEDL